MPLAMIGVVELGLLLLAGFFVFKMARGRCCAVPGLFGKALGVAAVLAGIWLLVSRDGGRQVIHAPVDHDELQEFNLQLPEPVELSKWAHDPVGPKVDFSDLFERGEFVDSPRFDGPQTVHVQSSLHLGLLIVLGSGLIILGALLFVRDKSRPFALKAITFLGIGAIIYALGSFFTIAPHREVARNPAVVEQQDFEHRGARRPQRPGRARRPAVRPFRPAGEEDEVPSELPPRAGGIPVEKEIDKQIEVELAAVAEPKIEEPKIEVAAAAAANVEETAKKIAAAADAVEPAAEVKEPPEATQPQPATSAPLDRQSGQRPAWVNAAPVLVDNVYTIAVSSGPWATVPECQHALDDEVLAAANNYINEYIGDSGAAALVNVSPNYLRHHVKKATFAEVIDSPAVGAMHQLHARLEFDDAARADFQRAWRNAVVEDRLWYLGGGAALVMALLATVYGYLKLDMKTDAAHKGRLQLAATLVALIVAAGALLARSAVF